MMKKTKKFLYFLLLSIMSISLSVTALAEEEQEHLTGRETPEDLLKIYWNNFIISDGIVLLEDNKLIVGTDHDTLNEVINDLNLLYQFGNVSFVANKIQVNQIDEIASAKQNNLNQIKHSTAYISHNNIIWEENLIQEYQVKVGEDPEAPNFNLQGHVKNNVKYLNEYEDKLMDLMIKYPDLPIMPKFQTDVEFASKVAEGQPWDFKRQIGWDKIRACMIDGKQHYLKGEDIGNIHYAYVGRSRGFSTTTLCAAGGIVQTLTSKGANLNKYNFSSYYDDPNDQVQIRRGANWYDTGVFK